MSRLGSGAMQEILNAIQSGASGEDIAALPIPESYRAAYVSRAAAAMCQGEEAHRNALRTLAREYPDDPDAASLFAESLMVPVRWRWWKDAKPAGEMALAIRTLEQILKRDPDHPGANHFYVHAMEMSPNPEYALPSAQRLMGGIAPGAGHLVHMAGHIYLRMGDYEVVAGSNERAIRVDEEYFHHSGVHGGYMGYYAHNLHFLTYARMMQGRYEDSLAAANKMVEAAQPFVKEAPALIDAFPLDSRPQRIHHALLERREDLPVVADDVVGKHVAFDVFAFRRHDGPHSSRFAA